MSTSTATRSDGTGGARGIRPATRPGRSKAINRGKYPFLLTFLALPMVVFSLFVISPYLQAFYLALTDWTGFTPTSNFVGLRNFRWLFGIGADLDPDKQFWRGLRNNVILLLVVPVVTIAIALFFASMLNLSGSTKGGQIRGVRGAGFYRILFFVPQVISVAALGIMFQQMYQPSGLLNSLLRLVGVENPPMWLTDTRTALLTVIIVMVWMNVGFYMVYFSAAMSGIPRELLEAASIDRASRWDTFRLITLPLLRPSIVIAMIYLGIAALDAFAIVQIMTVGPGGPEGTTTVMALSIFTSFKVDGQFGYATAQGIVLFVITLLLAAFTMRATKKDQVEM